MGKEIYKGDGIELFGVILQQNLNWELKWYIECNVVFGKHQETKWRKNNVVLFFFFTELASIN